MCGINKWKFNCVCEGISTFICKLEQISTFTEFICNYFEISIAFSFCGVGSHRINCVVNKTYVFPIDKMYLKIFFCKNNLSKLHNKRILFNRQITMLFTIQIHIFSKVLYVISSLASVILIISKELF